LRRSLQYKELSKMELGSFPSIATTADGPGTAGAGLRQAVEHPRRGMACGLVAIAAGAWVIAAPALFGADEAADWGWHPLALAAGPGCAAILGGLVMLTARPRGVRTGGLLAVGAGLLLTLGAMAGPLWAGDRFGATGTLEDGLRLLVWIGFFCLAGMLVAGFSAYALGWLDTPPWGRTHRRARSHGQCESRRRRASATLVRPHPSARRRAGG
jgi:hypothetical protein